ncbi:hypothetical protein [Xanthomarina sp. F2636L]|uniref:hypothetical protein n=1 Tax=Xanthomarina sp. F2636L TaxID=2996018 RepID=UPI00225DE081|nr:hypothetical protein [Xanthomarina sp. F2636L]MCX7551391.1 hypothetical protein [Xanthomarina sp. F2636L]
MKKVFSIVAFAFLLTTNLNANENLNNQVALSETMDCIDEARAIAFYHMANSGLSEDQGAELVLLLIQGC